MKDIMLNAVFLSPHIVEILHRITACIRKQNTYPGLDL